MKSKSIKVIDEHNIDRDANVMFALELEGSEYVVYWISRDEESNNVFVSKVLKNIDGTYNMMDIDEEEKKKDVTEIVKALISNSVSDQNDKLVGTTITLSNGKNVKFVNVLFNKEQYINVGKTYITTVKKEVTKVAETYYDVVVEEVKVEAVLPAAAPVVEAPVETPVVVSQPVETPVVVQPAPAVVETITVPQQPVTPEPVVVQPIIQPTPAPAVAPVIETPVVVPTPVVPVVETTPVVETPVVAPAPVAETPAVVMPQPEVVSPSTVPAEPVAAVATPTEPVTQPLVFNATKETNLNAALGEVANSATIPVEKIEPIREFGVETPAAVAPVATPADPVAPAAVPAPEASVVAPVAGKAGFANSKFFMVVAIAFFLASCVFLGYEVYNYFQLIK